MSDHTARPRSRRRLWLLLAGGALALAAVAAAVFQPWLLFVDTEVMDELPSVSTASRSTSAPGSAGAAEQNAAEQGTPSEPVLVSTGSFVSHEHETVGTASIYRLPDGTHQLAIAGLETTNGPDVHLWLSAGPVVEGRDGWFTAAEHEHLDLGEIKGNRGDQVYPLPEGVDPSQWPTVDLWCVSFGVSFGAAALTPVA